MMRITEAGPIEEYKCVCTLKCTVHKGTLEILQQVAVLKTGLLAAATNMIDQVVLLNKLEEKMGIETFMKKGKEGEWVGLLTVTNADRLSPS